jgi:sigma54-dependent transcription regulator
MADIGHNSNLSKEQLNEVAAIHARIVQHKANAKRENDKANAERKALKAMQIDLSAYAAASKRAAMDVDQRLNFDQSVSNMNAALGIPVQANLFDNDEGEPGDIPDAA